MGCIEVKPKIDLLAVGDNDIDEFVRINDLRGGIESWNSKAEISKEANETNFTFNNNWKQKEI